VRNRATLLVRGDGSKSGRSKKRTLPPEVQEGSRRGGKGGSHPEKSYGLSQRSRGGRSRELRRSIKLGKGIREDCLLFFGIEGGGENPED